MQEGMCGRKNLYFSSLTNSRKSSLTFIVNLISNFKNYKTRELCRVRNCHSEPPWTTCFICVTLDASCTDEDGRIKQGVQFGIKLAPWQPYCLKEGTHWESKGKTPVCAVCKKTNRTRNFCRERHMHRHLPWCTVYVTLTALDGTNTAENGMYVTTSTPASVVEMSANASTQAAVAALNIRSPSEGFLQPGNEHTDDINVCLGEDSSRTFLCMVNSAGCVIKWLDYEVLDESNMQVMSPNGTAAAAAFGSVAFGSAAAFGSADVAAAAAPWMQMYPQFYPQQQATDTESMANQQQQWMAYQQWMMMMQAQAAQYQQQQAQAQEQQTVDGGAPTETASTAPEGEEVSGDTGVPDGNVAEERETKRLKTEDEVEETTV